MYKLWVPINNKSLTRKNKQDLLVQLKKINPDTIMLTFNRILCNETRLKREEEIFLENKKFFEDNGFIVGCWLCPTIGYGAPGWFDFDAPKKFVRTKTVREGRELGAYCVLDSNFVEEFMKNIRIISKTGIKLLLLEDDYSLAANKVFNDPGCACDLHINQFNKLNNSHFTREEISHYLVEGEENEIRTKYLDFVGDTLKDFTKKIELEVHQIDKDIRIGISPNQATFEEEGTNSVELANIIANNLKPFARITGAPYWDNCPNLAGQIEAIRLQSYWFGDNTEKYAEADSFPRTRHWLSANYMECFDMILRADNSCDGILKYVVNYDSNVKSELGYIDFHKRNKVNYDLIEKTFKEFKTTLGFNVIENMSFQKIRKFDEDTDIDDVETNGYLPTASMWLTSDTSVPCGYGLKNTPSICFGENANFVTEEQLKNGLVLDILAAKRLMKMGIDVGIKSLERIQNPSLEKYSNDIVSRVNLRKEAVVYKVSLKKNAKILSNFVLNKGRYRSDFEISFDESLLSPSCWFYESNKGYKFVIYSFIAHSVISPSMWSYGLLRNYHRQAQLADAYKLLSGKSLPAMIYGAPKTYILCKKQENTTLVGIWNLSEDEIYEPTVELDQSYSKVEYINCNGRLIGEKIVLSTTINPYKFIILKLTK